VLDEPDNASDLTEYTLVADRCDDKDLDCGADLVSIVSANGFDPDDVPRNWESLRINVSVGGYRSLSVLVSGNWTLMSTLRPPDDSGVMVAAQESGQTPAIRQSAILPRLWRLFSYALSHRTRRRMFEPAYNELLDDYLSTWKEQSKWARRWLTIAYTLRTIVMVVDCLSIAMRDRAFRLLSGFLPNWVREWFSRLG